MADGRSDVNLRGLTVLLAALTACATPKNSYVADSTLVGPYIDATLALPSGYWRFLFPQTEACAAVLRPEAPIFYSSGGSFGRVRSPDGSRCDPVGIGTLHRWRRSRRMGEMAPSSPANWGIIYEGPEAFLLRGRFPVASRLGVANTFDVVVLVANDDVCAPIARSGVGTLVFRPSGRRVLNLARCPVLAVAMPPPATAP